MPSLIGHIVLVVSLSSPQFVSMWFIGLEFRKMPGGGSVNLTLTYEIQAFTNAGVYFDIMMSLGGGGH